MQPLFSSTVRTACCALVGVCLLAAGSVHAACTLTVSPPVQDFGSRMIGSLPAADLPDWLLLGQRNSTLTGVCDSPLSQKVRLRFGNAMPYPGTAGLLLMPPNPMSATPGALRLRAHTARAGNTAVSLSIEGKSDAPALFLDIPDFSTVVVLNLTEPLPAGTSFTVRMAMTAMLPASFTPSHNTTFTLQPSIELLP